MMKNIRLERRLARIESIINRKYESNNDNVIQKVGDSWKILKKSNRQYWNVEYKTKNSAEVALHAYYENKLACMKHPTNLVVEGFLSDIGKSLIRSVQSFLIKIFGHTLYFDHNTDKSIDLFYKGNTVAELLYNDKDEKITIVPSDTAVKPVSFYDTSEFEIKDYLSDLILGDLNPSYA